MKKLYDDENRLLYFTYKESGTPLNPSDPPVGSGDLMSEFHYDGFGRLRERIEYTNDTYYGTGWAVGSDTRYIYDGWRVIQERDGSDTPDVSYTRGPDLSGTLEGAGGIGGLLARSSGYSGGNWTSHAYYHADGNGNITCLVDGNQNLVAAYRYDPFGNTLAASGSLADANVYRFSSKEVHTNTAMYYYGYRFYDTGAQRWLNTDPADEPGAVLLQPPGTKLYSAADPGGSDDVDRESDEAYAIGNRYLFLMNNPEFWIDAFGLKWYDWPPIRWIRHGGVAFWWRNRKHQGPLSTPSSPNHGGGCFSLPWPGDPVKPPHKGVHHDPYTGEPVLDD